MKMQIHIVTRTTADGVSGFGQVLAAQFHLLAGQKPQTLCTWCFQVEQGHVAVEHFNASHPGRDLLSWYFLAALSLRRFKDHIGDRSVAAHQHLAIGPFFMANDVIMVVDLTNFTRHYFRKAFTTIAIAAPIPKREARTQAGFKQGRITLGWEAAAAG